MRIIRFNQAWLFFSFFLIQCSICTERSHSAKSYQWLGMGALSASTLLQAGTGMDDPLQTDGRGAGYDMFPQGISRYLLQNNPTETSVNEEALQLEIFDSEVKGFDTALLAIGLLGGATVLGVSCWVFNDCLKEFDRQREKLSSLQRQIQPRKAITIRLTSQIQAPSHTNSQRSSVDSAAEIQPRRNSIELVVAPPETMGPRELRPHKKLGITTLANIKEQPTLQPVYGRKLRGRLGQRLYVRRGFCGRLICNPCLAIDLFGRCCCDYDYSCCRYTCLSRTPQYCCTRFRADPRPPTRATPKQQRARPKLDTDHRCLDKTRRMLHHTLRYCTCVHPIGVWPTQWCKKKEQIINRPKRYNACCKHLGCLCTIPIHCHCYDHYDGCRYGEEKFHQLPCCRYYGDCLKNYFSHCYERRESLVATYGMSKTTRQQLLMTMADSSCAPNENDTKHKSKAMSIDIRLQPLKRDPNDMASNSMSALQRSSFTPQSAVPQTQPRAMTQDEAMIAAMATEIPPGTPTSPRKSASLAMLPSVGVNGTETTLTPTADNNENLSAMNVNSLNLGYTLGLQHNYSATFSTSQHLAGAPTAALHNNPSLQEIDALPQLREVAGDFVSKTTTPSPKSDLGA